MGKMVSAVAKPFAMTQRSGLPSQHHITQNIYLKLMAYTKNKKKAIALPVSSPNGPKTRRGHHGVNKQFEKLQTYLGSGMREERLEWIDSLHREFHYSKGLSDSQRLHHWTRNTSSSAMQEQYPHGFTTSQLLIFDPPNSFSITPPEEHEEAQMQTPKALEALKAIDKLLTTVQNHMMPKITAILGRYAPKQLEHQCRMSSSKGQLWTFLELFFAFAIKEGMTLGDWEGGYLVLPWEGLEWRIPIHPGDVFGFMAHTLHTSTMTKLLEALLLTPMLQVEPLNTFNSTINKIADLSALQHSVMYYIFLMRNGCGWIDSKHVSSSHGIFNLSPSQNLHTFTPISDMLQLHHGTVVEML
ncbi:uncharacterized protein F5147DRAFT_649776 [Suillus discolor]|uniref:Uncharacterized protein n=1 Tax=Suillus discolor TaxID=1912936 RepID=A0A9P7FCW9_9AGAM|nr:uncharacterized protein F5147DRAFT_649776 [Suillus discolor]KAG2114593.1 hypothetical protein F5147DRAFT_649776 [Suillus discolor]